MITEEFIAFFQQLEANNHKGWFHANKKTYDAFVKNPFLKLLDALLPELLTMEPRLIPGAKNALMRINRDIRFSKDKTPYHTIIKANLTPEGRKSGLPGYYLGIGAESIHVGGGLYQPTTAQVKAIRRYMITAKQQFLDIYENEPFQQLFGAIAGEKVKRLDANMQDHVADLPFLANKQFYYMARYPVTDYLHTDLKDFVLKYFLAASDMNRLLENALDNS
ncbi:MAG: DUF2461 domain-containing protein [Cyclobacteriaceae bacterium]|nr:DUF2461 domain-containing protein [Cyclobacteriaceae bacterium HetDA_MAG_MS6]